MNLLELMLKEEVEWPAGAEFAAQDSDREMKFCESKPEVGGSGNVWVNGCQIRTEVLAARSSDWSTRIITREEYQAAGGWMKWEGGGRTFESTSRVCVKFRGDTDRSATGIAYEYIWSNTGSDSDIIAYRIINQQPVQLDNPEIEPDFEPFVSIEDAHECKAEHAITHSKYTKQIRGVSVDVYDVLMAWGVTNPALQHLIKKALQCGQRGHKDKQQDLQDIIDSAIRAKELEQYA